MAERLGAIPARKSVSRSIHIFTRRYGSMRFVSDLQGSAFGQHSFSAENGWKNVSEQSLLNGYVSPAKFTTPWLKASPARPCFWIALIRLFPRILLCGTGLRRSVSFLPQTLPTLAQ